MSTQHGTDGTFPVLLFSGFKFVSILKGKNVSMDTVNVSFHILYNAKYKISPYTVLPRDLHSLLQTFLTFCVGDIFYVP
jgi:hypothetical protein